MARFSCVANFTQPQSLNVWDLSLRKIVEKRRFELHVFVNRIYHGFR